MSKTYLVHWCFSGVTEVVSTSVEDAEDTVDSMSESLLKDVHPRHDFSVTDVEEID